MDPRRVEPAGRIVLIYDLAARLGVSTEVGDQSNIVIVDTGTKTVGVIVDAVDEILTIDEEQIAQAPGTDDALIAAIAKLEDRLVVLLNPATTFGSTALAA